MLFVRRFYQLDLKLLSILLTSLALIYIVEMSKNLPAYNLEALPEVKRSSVRTENGSTLPEKVAADEEAIKQLIRRQGEALRDLFALFNEMQTLTLKYGLTSYLRIFPEMSANETKTNEVALYWPENAIFKSGLNPPRRHDGGALTEDGDTFRVDRLRKFQNDTGAKMCFV